LEGLGRSHAIPHFRCSAQDPSLQANVALWSLRLGDLGRGLAVDLPYAIYDIYSMCGNIWHTHTEIIYVYIYKYNYLIIYNHIYIPRPSYGLKFQPAMKSQPVQCSG
jgi:hypothetical protein